MKLRDHPLMSYRGVSNWPPAWVGKDTKELQQPSGEIGILKNAILSKLKPHSRFYLLIEYEGEEYLGTLFLIISPRAIKPTNFYPIIVASPFVRLVKLMFPSADQPLQPCCVEERAKYAVP
jgi:hypothetical protein